MNKSNIESTYEEMQVGDAEAEAPQFSPRLEDALARLEAEWDLDGTARESGALLRKRGILKAFDLLRIVMGYSVLDLSLRQLGMWGVILGISQISKTALLNRLRKCQVWFGQLVVRALIQQKLRFPPVHSRVRLKLFDASVISQPGSRGTDWRLHLGFDLGRMNMDWIEVTDQHGGEGLQRFSLGPGDLCVADRGYAVKSSVGYALAAGAWLLVRVGWLKLPFEDMQGQRWDVITWLKQAQLIPGGQSKEVMVWVSTDQGRFALRFLAQALPEEAAEKARRRLRKQSKNKGKTVDERSLFAAGFVLLATNLPATDWNMVQIFQWYRFRWQIELAFKRLKSLLRLDGLRTRDAQLVQVYLLSKLLAALLLERIQLGLAQQHPEAFSAQDRPLSYWRLTELLWDELRSVVRGQVTLQKIFAVFPSLLRFLSDEPRRRISQRSQAQSILSGLCGC